MEVLIIFIRIEPSSSTPIYRQIIDQIKYQVVSGVLKKNDRLPSVRELATELAVNQNTILKVYNELCRENVLKVERGEGTFVASGKSKISPSEKKLLLSNILREAAVIAIQLDISIAEAKRFLEEQFTKIEKSKNRRSR